jgi:hypothetical protein
VFYVTDDHGNKIRDEGIVNCIEKVFNFLLLLYSPCNQIGFENDQIISVFFGSVFHY